MFLFFSGIFILQYFDYIVNVLLPAYLVRYIPCTVLRSALGSLALSVGNKFGNDLMLNLHLPYWSYLSLATVLSRL